MDWRRVILALQSTLEREIAWALNLTATMVYTWPMDLMKWPDLLQALLIHLEVSAAFLSASVVRYV